MHDFVKWFPYGVSIVLGASLLIAVFVVPLLQFSFIRKGLKKDPSKKSRRTFLEIIQQYYNKLIEACFAHPFITLGIGAISIIIGGVMYSNMPQKMMPRAERDQFAVEIYMPTGTAIEQTAQVADSLRNLMRKDPRVLNVTTFYGSGSPRFQAAYAPQIGGTNFAQFIINTKSDEETVALLNKFTPMYTNYFSNAMVRFKQLDYSDAIAPLEIRYSSDNLLQLHVC